MMTLIFFSTSAVVLSRPTHGLTGLFYVEIQSDLDLDLPCREAFSNNIDPESCVSSISASVYAFTIGGNRLTEARARAIHG